MEIKDKILVSAANCIKKYGYQKTTLEDIGRSIGLKKNSLYYYYKNKDEIILNVITHELNRLNDLYKSELAEVQGIEKKVLKYFLQKTQACGDNSILNSVLTEIMVPSNPLYDRVLVLMYANEVRYLESILRVAFEQGQLKECNYRFLAESLSILYDSIKQEELKLSPGRYREDLNSPVDDYINFIISSIISRYLV